MKAEIVERSSGFWIVGKHGVIDGPFLELEEAQYAIECPECGNHIDSDGFCGMCSQAAAEFEDMAYGSPTREERGYSPASDDLPIWQP